MALFSDVQTKLIDGGSIYVTFAASSTTSDVLDMTAAPLGFIFPAGFPAAIVTFQVSIDGKNFYSLVDGYSGMAININAIAASQCRVAPADFVGVKSIKLVSSVAPSVISKVAVVCGIVL
jgi:hypothetical protein